MSSPHSSAAVSASGVNASGSPGMSGSVARDRTLPDILTYRFSSEMVYVTLGETYEARLTIFNSLMRSHSPVTGSSKPSILLQRPFQRSETSIVT